MATQDSQFDDLIFMALDYQALVPPEQKAIAWDRVRRRASASVQRINPAPRRDPWRRVEHCLQGLRHMLLSEDIYHRAARNRHYGPKGLPLTGDFTIHHYPLFHMDLARS